MRRMQKAPRRKGALAFDRGQRDLARHRPDRALEPLRSAVDECPAVEKRELARRLYWLAVALLRLDRTELAIKSLASAQKLRPRGLARAAYVHRVNSYGMPRRATPELDDFWAFFSIQTCRYLGSRPGRRFAAAAEKDLVTRMIAGAWVDLRRSGKIDGSSLEERLKLFNTASISFPTPVGLGSPGRRTASSPIASAGSCADPGPVDFRRGRRVKAEDRCPCGSGLPYCQCCGRTKSPLELDE